jgi:hypothetical protein
VFARAGLLFRKLSIAKASIVELREWSRIDEELKVEHGRLTNRLRHQLWHYYPQMLELADDIGANWFLDLFEAVPTPEKAASVREKTIARILKSHRIRRFDAAHVLTELRKPALTVAPGTIEAATARIRGLIERIRLINGQLADTKRQHRTPFSMTPSAGPNTTKGHGHARSLHSVIDRLLKVACAMLNSGTLFDPEFAGKRAIG